MNILEYFKSLLFFVCILLVSDVQQMSQIQKTSPDPLNSDQVQIRGSKAYRGRLTPKALKQKIRLQKLSEIFIQQTFKNLSSFEVQSPGSVFFLPKPDPHPCNIYTNIESFNVPASVFSVIYCQYIRQPDIGSGANISGLIYPVLR